ncbi:hypothetical protein [Mucisphaera sp.]|uniref:hypothetical protein n=1 Tax=Mucisphaera sp. TaxID=2913024 RepID=UPI003D12F0D7
MLNVYGRRLFAWLGCVVVLLVGAGVSLAIQPVTVVHETEADFSDGTTESARVTTRGRIALAPETADVIELGEDLTTLFGALRLADEEAWLLAAGPKGLFLGRAERGAVAVEGVADEEQVFVITRVGERVVVGISGETSRLAVYSEGAVTTVMALPGVRYIWEVVDLGRGMVAVATGTEGKVLVAMLDAPEREPRVALETGQANVLSLVVGADGETLFAGTDGEGLVYRVRIVEGEPEVYVMYDAPEPEIASLVVTTDGSLLVGTADSEQARPGAAGGACGVFGGCVGGGGGGGGGGGSDA